MTIIIINKVIKGGTVRDASHGETLLMQTVFLELLITDPKTIHRN